MNNREELINIYLIYKDLLTKKQQEYFKYYYFEDLSLSEISENMLVSKAFVGKTLKQIENKLNDLESTLKINTLYNKVLIILLNVFFSSFLFKNLVTLLYSFIIFSFLIKYMKNIKIFNIFCNTFYDKI